ncbi:hypothetical protein [Streptomyces sp. HUAS ZL42]
MAGPFGDALLEESPAALLPALRETAATIEADLCTASRFRAVRIP